ncbi:hypothetical protein LTR10_017920 [Elasticomyces elasticus]|uniref:Nephrocystin 3-like N-terminal domain-containing protein n=1 Tax=Exophiala sideris TaxID=1016849 RepID=A0ABR0IWE7_9EURO|nr:hypothetical protein LTR10_017920 [Elasticomyces elasticus]KAK5021788.1 hypothetical protein LTS07_010683 [Exophiala sideris]KAK5025852.1 hypothetical protein LTR13_010316 [Exophiala sideris]KAK5050216.1 hypothetical protein LTR69_010704 [Exophiala sideris]KAK5177025.1 hypothetical protein LTR44_010462 [Eurotiomycetes sp. CCFEE 6388]
MIDPVTTFALACNIFQAAQWCYQAGQTVYQLYKDGTTPANRSLEELTNHLTTALEGLQSPKIVALPTEDRKDLEELQKLAEMCSHTGEDLRKKLATVTNSNTGGNAGQDGKDGKRKRLLTAVRAVWEKGSIERLQKSLKEIEDRLHTITTVDVWKISRRSEALTKEQSEKLQKLYDECHSSFDHVQGAFDNIRHDIVLEVNKQGSETRDMITNQKAYERLLNSVAFVQMNSRGNSPSVESHEGTFEHILVENGTGDWSCFITWLRTGNGVYWVYGKPGSGKSTLMKFLLEHNATKHELGRWAKGKEVKILGHFFWSTGSDLQKDPTGYLLTILHQAWIEDEEVVSALLQQNSSWRKKWSHNDWSLKELKDALKTTLQLPRRSYCIFIDGLDECTDQDEILNHIDAFEREVDIKFCVSSRPETVFEEKLNKCPKLRLQDLNKPDIKLFVEESFDRRLRPDSLTAITTDQLHQLRDDLISWSEGVFLWVRLTTKTILHGIRNDGDWEKLRSRLQQTAGDIEALYQDMWDRLNQGKKVYKDEAALILNFVLKFNVGSFGYKPTALLIMLLLNGDMRREHLNLTL